MLRKVRSKSIVSVVVAAVASLSLLASCTAASSGDSTQSNAPFGPVELNMLVSAGSSGDVFTAAAEKWGEKTGNKINVTSMPQGDVRQQEVLALSQKSDSLDILPLATSWLTQMIGDGDGMVDIGKLAAEDGWSSADIMPGAFNQFTFKGTQYAVPVRGGAYLLAYREDLLKAAGFSAPPTTWDEFNTMAKALTDSDKNQYGAAITMAQVSLMIESWQSVVTSYGGMLVNAGGQLTLDSPEVVQATQMIANWLKDGVAPPDSLQFSDTEIITACQQGRVAMGIISAAWYGKITDPQASEFADQWKIAPRLPSGGTGNGQTVGFPWGMGINPSSKHVNEAWDFIKYISDKETQLYLATEKNNSPITLATYEDPAYVAIVPMAPQILSATSDNASGSPEINGWGDVQTALQADVSAIYAGDKTAVDGLGAANKELQKFLS